MRESIVGPWSARALGRSLAIAVGSAATAFTVVAVTIANGPIGMRMLGVALVVGLGTGAGLRFGHTAALAAGAGVGGALAGLTIGGAIVVAFAIGVAVAGMRAAHADALRGIGEVLRYAAVAVAVAVVSGALAGALAWFAAAGSDRIAAISSGGAVILGLVCIAPAIVATRSARSAVGGKTVLAVACTAYSVVLTTWVFFVVDPADPGAFGWPFVAAAGALVAAAALGVAPATWQTLIVAVGSVTATAHGRGRYALDLPTSDGAVLGVIGFACFIGLLAVGLATLRDERINLVRSAQQSMQVLDAIVDATPAVIFAKEFTEGKDGPGRYILANGSWLRAFQRPLASVVGRTEDDLFAPADARRHLAEDLEVLGGRSRLTVDEVGVGPGERGRAYRTEKFPLKDADGRTWGVGGVAIDVTAIRDAQVREQRQASLLRAVFDQSPTPAVLVAPDDDGALVVSATNAAMSDLIGDHCACAGDLGACVVDEDRETVREILRSLASGESGAVRPREIRLRRPDGTVRWVRLSAAAVPDADGRPAEVVVQFEDFTATRDAEHELSVQALRDPVTGLPNRNALHERLAAALTRLARRPGMVALLFCDLDNFKQVNDTLGHGAGDDLLREVAGQLRSAVRRDDVVARLGGDEFVVVTEGLADAADAVAFGMRLQERVRSTGHRYTAGSDLTMSVGIAVATTHTLTVEEVLRRADLAMYRAKAAGRNRIEVYDTDADDALRHTLAVQQEIRRAIDVDAFEVHHQPIVRLADSSVVRSEALVRMRDSGGNLRMPDWFIAEAESSGLIVPLGRAVARRAVADLVVLRERYADMGVAINLSPVQLREEGFTAALLDAARDAGVDPTWVGVEITETALLNDPERAVAELEALRAAGVRIALDDFGTGYSSLTWLTQFPVDVVKVDRSFTSELGVDPRRTALTRALISVALELGLSTVAEGVETAKQRDLLTEYGCEFGQGYFFGRPVPLDQEPWVASGPGAGSSDRVAK